MRASRLLRHRALRNRTRYAVRAIAFEVLPQMIDAMKTMQSTQRMQNDALKRAFGKQRAH